MSVAMGHNYIIVGSTKDLTTLDSLIAEHQNDPHSPFAYLTVKPIPNPTTAPEQRRFSLNFSHRYQPVNALWDIIEPRCPSLIAFAWVWDEITMQDEDCSYIYFAMNGKTQHGRSGRKPRFAIDPRLLAALEHKNPNWIDINHMRRLRSYLRILQTYAARIVYIVSGRKARNDAAYRARLKTSSQGNTF